MFGHATILSALVSAVSAGMFNQPPAKNGF
jgi:hypothetical protein